MAHSILGDDRDRDNLFDFDRKKFLHDYPGRVVDEVTEALSLIEDQKTRLLGASRLATAPFAPFFQTAYRQAGDVLAPFVNRQQQAFIDIQNQFAEQQGLPRREHEPITGEQLAAPIAAAGSLLRGKFPTWFSPARRAVTTAPQQKGDLNYWLGRIKKEKGGTSEAKQLGLVSTQGEATESLLSAAPGTLTKEEALSLIEPIELEETVLGISHVPTNPTLLDAKEFFGITDEDWGELTPYQQQSYVGEILEGGPHIRTQDNTEYASNATLNLPGGTNPREILIQLPTWQELQNYMPYPNIEDGTVEKIAEIFPATPSRNAVSEYAVYDPKGNRVWQGPSNSSENAMNDAVNSYESKWRKEGAFTGGHYGSNHPNVLGHIRLWDHMIGGKKSLHSDEYQLDWWQGAERARRARIRVVGHQEGISRREAAKLVPKDYGYNIPSELINTIRNNYLAVSTEPSLWSREKLSQAGVPTELINQWWDERMGPGTARVPNEPYKEKGWDLLFKRHFMEAIRDPSIERITWTTGDVQADRYDLSNTIDSIDVRLMRAPGSGRVSANLYYELRIVGKDGGSDDTIQVLPNQLEDHVGKDLADRIMNEVVGEKTYEGLDLEIGGEFLKLVYQNKAPQFFKEFLKPWDVTPKEIQFDESSPPYAVWDTGEGGGIVRPVSSRAEGQAYIEEVLGEAVREGWDTFEVIELDAPKVWYIDITPEMRETYSEGVPLAMREDEEGLLGRYA